jgi:hypothetical protein
MFVTAEKIAGIGDINLIRTLAQVKPRHKVPGFLFISSFIISGLTACGEDKGYLLYYGQYSGMHVHFYGTAIAKILFHHL